MLAAHSEGNMTVSRRELVAGVTLALLAVPLAIRAQPGKAPGVGLLETGSLAG